MDLPFSYRRAQPSDASNQHFRVLVVCTGNICRSPYAAESLRLALRRLTTNNEEYARVSEEVSVTSAGTHAVVGAGAAPPMANAARQHGVDLSEHLAAQIMRDDIAHAGLILTSTREHRKDVVRLVPSCSSVTFTLVEFARLTVDASDGHLPISEPRPPEQRMAEFVRAVASRRGFAIPPADPAEDDIPDPYGRDEPAYLHAVNLINTAISAIERGIASAMGQTR